LLTSNTLPKQVGAPKSKTWMRLKIVPHNLQD
jgi:hypothetical protein